MPKVPPGDVPKNGEWIENLLCDINLSTLKTGAYTYISKTNATASVIDITAINLSSLDIAKWRVLKCAVSDPFQIITRLGLNIDSPPQKYEVFELS
ncbi:hypothetical protein TNCV_4636851 [Trichonephila clavipes]|nr:hypothetical protein TNCV_4636851 [Trichonephila clavipes]